MNNIKQLFVLMLENRSYDNIFGFSGFCGPDPRSGEHRLAEDLTRTQTFSLPTLSGGRSAVTRGASFQLGKSGDGEGPAHEFTDTLLSLCGCAAFAGGSQFPENIRKDHYVCNDGVYPNVITDPNDLSFAIDYELHGGQPPNDVLRCFDPEQLPVLNALARQYVVCDHWFSSLPGPTWPNRFFALCGSSGGLDHSPSNVDSIIDSIGLDGFSFRNGCLFERLSDQWLVAFEDFPQSLAIKGLELKLDHFVRHRELFNRLRHGTLKESFIWIEPDYDATFDFELGNSMHPLGDVRRGEALVKKIYEEIRRSKYWESSALVVLFDEHGGFFDHVVPPGPSNDLIPGDTPIDASYSIHNFRFNILGARVPAIVVSPWVVQGGIDATCYDHTSLIKTASDLFGLGEVNLGNRSQRARSFADLFNLERPRLNDDATPMKLPKPKGHARTWWKVLFRCFRRSRQLSRASSPFATVALRRHMATHGMSVTDCKVLTMRQLTSIINRPR